MQMGWRQALQNSGEIPGNTYSIDRWASLCKHNVMSQRASHRRQFLRMTGGGLLSALGTSRGGADAPVRIDVGRQLFVDDYVISETSLRRVFHKPRIHEASPVLKPETPLEMNDGY